LQCEDTCSIVLEKARTRWEDIDDFILAGGSTRMPMVQAMLRRLSGKEPAMGVNPDECVALGAALAAVFRHRPEHPALAAYRSATPERKLSPDVEISDPDSGIPRHGESGSRDPTTAGKVVGLPGVRITDVATHPLGMVVLDANLKERVVNLIPEFTALPCDKRGRFAYAYDKMTAVRVEVTEGHGTARDEVTVIGEVVLDNLPPRPRGTPIEVVYRYTVNQILEVDVTDVETRTSRRARINLRGSIDDTQKAEARERIARASIT
jgi:molecular chaperone DnaK